MGFIVRAGPLIDLLAERQVLAACMAGVDALEEVLATGIKAGDFAGVSGALTHEAIFKAILGFLVSQGPVTPLTVTLELADGGVGIAVPIYSVLSKMDTELQTVVGIAWWAERVIAMAKRRRLAAAGHAITESAGRGALEPARAHAILGEQPQPIRPTITRPIPPTGAKDANPVPPTDHQDADDRGPGGGGTDDSLVFWP